MTPDDEDPFFHERLEWSKYKHDILNKYLHVWASKLGSFPPHQLAFVDGCAGAGYYGEGSKRTDGSPVMAAKWNDHEILRNRNGKLVVHACETDPTTAAKLAEALNPWTSRTPAEAIIYTDSFEEVLPEILEATRRVPTLFFIDPYGADPITSDKLKPLLEHKGRRSTEVLIRIDPTLLARFAGWVQSQEKKGQSETRKKTAASFRKRLQRYNIDVDAIASAPEKPEKMKLFAEYLQLFEKRFEYVQIIPIRPSYFAAPKYYLVHGTDSPHGAAKINDAVSTTEDSLFKESDRAYRIGQGSLFEVERPPRFSLTDAKAFILAFLSGHGPTDFVHLKAALALKYGPDFREKDHRVAVKDLLSEGKLERDGSGELTDRTVIQLRTAK
jgi:three-Cys-motif partner protein